mgnify:CR=1 FL=1
MKCIPKTTIAEGILNIILTLTQFFFPLRQVNGIKGASVFLLFKPFNLVKGFVIDWMHSVCLGVTKSLINLWLNAENRGKEFFLGSKVK